MLSSKSLATVTTTLSPRDFESLLPSLLVDFSFRHRRACQRRIRHYIANNQPKMRYDRKNFSSLYLPRKTCEKLVYVILSLLQELRRINRGNPLVSRAQFIAVLAAKCQTSPADTNVMGIGFFIMFFLAGRADTLSDF